MDIDDKFELLQAKIAALSDMQRRINRAHEELQKAQQDLTKRVAAMIQRIDRAMPAQNADNL
jgi:predicted transcriptional regulator